MKEKLIKYAKLIGSVIAIVFSFSIFVFAILLNFGSCNDNRKVKNENPIDSIQVRKQIRKNELIKKFDCDTSYLFSSSDFTFKKEKILSRLNRPILVKVEVTDINQKNDSLYILTGECWGNAFEGIKFVFELKRINYPVMPEEYCEAICVIKDFKLSKLQTPSMILEDNTVLSAECVYFEKE